MLVINVINCKHEGAIKTYTFTLSIYNESFIAGNISIFEDLNIIQIGFDKTDPQWAEWLTI